MDGALIEVGPFRVNPDQTLAENPGSWHEFANLLFVDQPLGTGFSYVNTDHYVHELDEMANQFIVFMTEFFRIFPEYESDNIYFAGESYAGQHIPYIADAIIKRNKKNPPNKWNLKGLLIGNGWIDPEPQYNSYTTYAYKHGILEKDSNIANSIEAQLSICRKDLAGGTIQSVDTRSCEKVLSEMLKKTNYEKGGERFCYNMYDIRLQDKFPACGMNWPPDLASMTPYLRKKEVIEALHVDPDKTTGWVECSGSVSSSFDARNSKPSVHLLPKILEQVPILLFSGDQDLICNHIGTEELIHNMEWNGGKGFELSPGNWAPREEWVFQGESAGMYQTARNLTYVLFYNSSHMVPFDVPLRSRDMLERFIGVNIDSIGGAPTDSRIAGEKGPLTAVSEHPDSSTAQEEERHRLQAARWDAYYRSGEIALILVATAAVFWGIFIWRQRQKHSRRGYKGVHGGAAMEDESRVWDDEAQMNELRPIPEGRSSVEDDRYSLGGASSDDESVAGRTRTKG
jgi:carboxypeptidase D